MKHLGKKPPEERNCHRMSTVCEDDCHCKRDHYRQSLIEAADELETIDNYPILELSEEGVFRRLVKKLRISAGQEVK